MPTQGRGRRRTSTRRLMLGRLVIHRSDPVSESVEFQAELYADYLNFERGLSPLTVRAYGRELEKFVTFVTERGRCDPSSVRGDDLRDYVFHLGDLGLAPTSVRRAQSALRTYFGFLLEEGTLRSDPTEGIQSPRVGRPLPRVGNQVMVPFSHRP